MDESTPTPALLQSGLLQAGLPLAGLPVVYTPDVLAHVPSAEVWVGVATAGTEVPQRALVLRDALTAAGAQIVPATHHGDEILTGVHSAELVGHLAQAHQAWVRAGWPVEPGAPDVVPYVFPTEGLLCGMPARRPTAIHARAGLYCYDTMTVVGSGTWIAARAAVDAALTAVDLVLAGVPVAYALCRPPGHHATPTAYGGSCYLNNAAVAAHAMRRGGRNRVAVIDIDAHHGNGTQAVFYECAEVFYGSVHVDPGAGWFPHYLGFATETGRGPGRGANLNVPLAPGCGDQGWLAGVRTLCAAAAAHGVQAVVLSLGVDAAVDDPESPLQVSVDGFAAAGRLIAELGVPVVAVQEGGYHLPTLGPLTVATLGGLLPAGTGQR